LPADLSAVARSAKAEAPETRRREPREKALAGMLKPYEPLVRKLAAGLRAVVRSEVAPCHETIFEASYTIALLYGANARISENFCYISVHRRHVNLGFQRGSLLENPDGVLKGDGPWMRHIQIKSPADLDRPELRAFLQAACAEADHAPSPGRKGTVLSIVKRAKPSKRRLPRRSSGREK
jgi:hypothetical protein